MAIRLSGNEELLVTGKWQLRQVSDGCRDYLYQCDQKKSPNVYKSWPKMISLENRKILTPLQKLPKNNGDLGKLIVAKGTGTFFRQTYF